MKNFSISISKIFTFAFLLLIFEFAIAQSPQGTSYQAVIRNATGALVSNKTVSLRFSLHDSAANGNVVYQETQNPVTTAQGLVNVNVGQGVAVVGSFANINWGNKSKFLQVELDVNGGTSYTDMGTQQLMSVPYSLYANASNTANTANTANIATRATKADTALYAANTMPSGTAPGQMMYWNGSSWVNVSPGTNGQNLTFCNGVPQWGPCLILPTVQTGSITAKTAITATAGGNVTDSGSAKITGRGVCYSTTINPTIANTKTASGTNVIGAFTVSLTGLSASTTYHYRAYATTSVGTSYGADSVFTTNAATVPTLTTTAASTITGITATSGGNITSDNGSAITARGVCWSTTANPTISLATKTIDGTGTGAFTSSITGLTSNTLYYVRAYATNSAGTAYGAQVSFTTLRLPTVTTGAITNITNSTATASGNVTDSGSRTVTARGICYATTPSPIITNSIVVASGTNSTGSFTVPLSGFSANTRYYVRAFVTTSVGTSYGVDSVFTTASAAVLPSVTIGKQLWSSKNLDVATYRNGDPIPQVTDPTQWAGLTTGAWCWYNNNVAYSYTYGRLYNWYAVNDARGLAPQGWHVPSNAEWATLETTLGGSSVAGGAMKSTTGWSQNLGATNSSGFSALPGGYRFNVGIFGDIDNYGYWWSSTEYDTANALTRYLLYNNSSVNSLAFTKSSGLSVRCVRDTTPSLTTTNATIITNNSATSGGNITSDNGATVTVRGVCWSTTANPTIALSTKTIDSSGVGTFTSNITGLTPNTTYYVRAYATNSVGTAYGNQVSFNTTTASVPVLTTTNADTVYRTSAFCGGYISDDGGSPVIERGVCWSIISNPTTALTTKTSDGNGTGVFNSNLSSLLPNTTYYARAYAKNSIGTSYGNQITFTTQPITTPSVSTLAVNGIHTTGITSIPVNYTSGGVIYDDGGANIIQKGICWDINHNPTINLSTKTTDGSGSGSYTSNMIGLNPNTTYYVRAYATNSAGTSYDAYEWTFTTSAPPIGQNYQGGVIAYIFQPGDNGYVAGETHGLIAASVDQSGPVLWHNGTYSSTGATGTAIGTGADNTDKIVLKYGAGNYAAKICSDLVLNGYSDWYLPSREEMNKLYLNKFAIGNFQGYYWISSDNYYNYLSPISLNFASGTFYINGPNWNANVRAIRNF